MAQYKTDINEYVEEKATKITDAEEFYEHVDTAKLKVFENGKDDTGVYTEADAADAAFEMMAKICNMLDVRWLRKHAQGIKG